MSRAGQDRTAQRDEAALDATRNADAVRAVWAWLAKRGIKRGRSIVAALDAVEVEIERRCGGEP